MKIFVDPFFVCLGALSVSDFLRSCCLLFLLVLTLLEVLVYHLFSSEAFFKDDVVFVRFFELLFRGDPDMYFLIRFTSGSRFSF